MSATAVLQYKGESQGAIFAKRKALLAARDLRDTDQRVYDICLKYGFDSQPDLYPRLHPDLQSAAGRLPVKRTTVAPTEAGALPGLAFERKPATPPAQHQILNGAQCETSKQNNTV